ncbi:GGDEF domain-containing response regulator [Desulfococcus multivorans]|uniref:diguanylate cyclase n=1 Tax=Desulfococcus multivorans DSM 2059 TaxID=1121405 RepID=S7US92_DESML|nr:diguanylate cyclase [Desulfococcus multivorans]AOY58788.1 response regulator modulated diguanylate cyclase (GGDEF domain) [Desulfococcus multivorans]AQV01072.1 diguanylate cyclase response regulator [Desulfococcus multivorans]EPR35168.1 response regulator receiver modulated diguanylate cyclase [Desulfococcus multivorans DSM 2059]SJZ50276.1 two-component system, chemotaxis family, response regulator CheY [Desulfococcus multivorans DSM 2059]
MKILIVEDEPISKRVLEANLLDWGYDVVTASDGREALEILQSPEAPSLVISDWVMPRMDGLTLCRKIRKMTINGYTYVILLTAKEAKADEIKGLEAGADDFLTKPFNRQELKYRTRIGERIINLERRILKLANTDALTGVLNRRAFMEKMHVEMARSRREMTPFSLVLCDIDHFKEINDTHGHQIGDAVLQAFTKRLSAAVRPYDFIGRYGGEEFLIGLPGTDLAEAASAAQRMRKSTENTDSPLIDAPEGYDAICITASFGAAVYTGDAEDTSDHLIKRVDDALYRAKREGRNLVCVTPGRNKAEG